MSNPQNPMSNPQNPVDHARTTQPGAGLALKDRRELPGVALVMWSVICVVGFMTALTMHDVAWMVGLGVLTLVTLTGGVAWIWLGRRRTDRLDGPT